MESKNVALFILNISTRWIGVINFTLLPLYIWEIAYVERLKMPQKF